MCPLLTLEKPSYLLSDIFPSYHKTNMMCCPSVLPISKADYLTAQVNLQFYSFTYKNICTQTLCLYVQFYCSQVHYGDNVLIYYDSHESYPTIQKPIQLEMYQTQIYSTVSQINIVIAKR